MRVRFAKMQGAGNDFVVVDATREPFALDAAQLKTLADRRFGVGGRGPLGGVSVQIGVRRVFDLEVEGRWSRSPHPIRRQSLPPQLSVRLRAVSRSAGSRFASIVTRPSTKSVPSQVSRARISL